MLYLLLCLYGLCGFSSFVYLVNNLYQPLWIMDTYYVLWLWYNVLVCCSDYPTFGHWELFQLVPVYLTYPHCGVCVSLTILCFLALWDALGSPCVFLPRCIISHFYKKPWLLSSENGVRIPDMAPRHVCCYLDVIVSMFCQLTKQGHVGYTCIHVGYTNLTVYVYLHICRCISNHVFKLVSPTLIILPSWPCLSLNVYPNSERPVVPTHAVHSINCSIVVYLQSCIRIVIPHP